MKREAIAAVGGVAAVAAAVGPFLPWMPRTSAAGQVYDMVFSPVSRPNAEWLIWFAAPLWASVAGSVGLLRHSRVGLGALLPCAVFLVAWAALLLSGYRAYTGFSNPGFAVAWVGVVGLSVAGIGCIVAG